MDKKQNYLGMWLLITDYGTHKAHSASTKINPSSGNLKWINIGYKANSQGYRKSKMDTWLFLAP